MEVNMPEEIFEKAARAMNPEAWDEREWQRVWDPVVRSDYMGHAQTKARESARAALSAAAPLIAAQAWDEGFSDGLRQDGEGEDGPRYVNPYRMKEHP